MDAGSLAASGADGGNVAADGGSVAAAGAREWSMAASGAGEGKPARRTRMPAGQRRESILDAAAVVFAAAGYHAAKVSDVAARVGVTEPVVFQNFGSKAALFAAVLHRVVAEVHADLDTLAERFGSVSGVLAHVLGSPHPHWLHGQGSHGSLFADAAALAGEAGLGETATRAARAVADHLAGLIRRGQADGDLRADLDPQAAAWLLLSVLATRPLRAAAGPDHDRLDNDVAALALRALTAPAGQAGERSRSRT